MSVLPEASKLVQQISDLAVSLGQNEEDDPTHADYTKFLSDMGNDTLILINDELQGNDSRSMFSVLVQMVYNTLVKHGRLTLNEARIREYIVLIDPKRRGRDYTQDLALVEGLHCLPQLKQDRDMTRTGDENVTLCRAIIAVTRAADSIKNDRHQVVHHQEDTIFLQSSALIKLVITNTDRVPEIVEFIIERQNTDLNLLKDALSAIKPLREGTL